MEGWLGPLLVLVVWVLLQRWLLPRLGVPTWSVPDARRSARPQSGSSHDDGTVEP